MLLTEYVRQALRRIVVKPYLDAQGNLPGYLMDPGIEQIVESSVQHGEQSSHATLSPPSIRELLQKVSHKVGNPETPVLAIVSSGSRYFLRQMVEPTVRNLFFISHNEIPMEVKIVSLGVIQ